MKLSIFICTIFLMAWAHLGWAQELPVIRGLDPIYVAFIANEQSNSYSAKDSTVDERYQSKDLKPFRVGYLEIPADRLNIETSHANDALLDEHFYVAGSRRGLVRFFIHPNSEHLYRPLIKEFGYKGFYQALATASTRTVLAWDPERPRAKPLFLKLSLAQMQDGLGRIVPGWEVRRSVRVTDMIDADLKAGRVKNSQVKVIPEVAGAFVKASEGMGFHVDEDQGQVFEHGMILRDASFIEQYRGKLVVPIFWLFSRSGGQEPPIIRIWKKSSFYRERGVDPADSLARFLEEEFFRPFIQKNLPLMLFQGIVPQIHGQNVVGVFDPKTYKLEALLHRDIGSMKTDYRLRWIQGLPTTQLRSLYADKDFGLSWGAESIEPYHLNYLHDWLLKWAYLGNIRRHVKNFDPEMTRNMVRRVLNQEIAVLLQSTGRAGPTRRILEYIEEHAPEFKAESPPSAIRSSLHLRTFLVEREGLQQSVSLPQSWQQTLTAKNVGQIGKNGYLLTSYGVIYSGSYLGRDNQELKIAFYPDLNGPAPLLKSSYQKQVLEIRPVCRSVYRASGF